MIAAMFRLIDLHVRKFGFPEAHGTAFLGLPKTARITDYLIDLLKENGKRKKKMCPNLYIHCC